MYLSWIIPAYNEERRIERTLREVDAYLRSRNFSGGYEIIVSNSASKDRTKEVVTGLSAQIPHLRILNLENKGKGYAVRQGMLAAQGMIRLFSDADNSTPPESFDLMKPFFERGYEVVISSRNAHDAPGASRDVKEQWYREFLGMVGNFIIQIFGVWGIWDTQNGFKAVTAHAAERIFSKTKMNGFSFDIEMLALAKKFGYKIGIIPVRWVFDPDSKVTLSAYLNVFFDVFRIRLNLLIGTYGTK